MENFSDLHAFEQMAKKELLPIVQNRTRLRQLILGVPKNPKLLSSCIHYDALDKIVLWNSDDQKMQLRLHIYSDQPEMCSPSQIDITQAHNHRWNFTTFILSGGYHHILYRMDNNQIIPIMVREERKGDCYTLHHSQYHSIIEQPNTVTLLIRGPLEKESFQTMKGSVEALKEKEKIAMDKDRLSVLLDKLQNLEII